MDDAPVEVEGLIKVYEPSPLWMRFLLRTAIKSPVTALDDVSLKVNRGEILAVVGPNGAGKSTLFRVLTGLTTPTEGRASVMGFDVTRQSTAVRRLVGFMPAEERTLWLRHTCRENLLLHGRLQGIPSKELDRRINDVLDQVGLGEAKDRVGFALSSGMRARLMLARAILHEPLVLILDEPTGAVDPVASYQLLNIIKRMAKERELAILLSSHRLDEIESLEDNVLLLNRGKVVSYGSLQSLRSLWERPRIEISFEDAALTSGACTVLQGMEQVDVARVDDRSISVSTDLSIGHLLAAVNGQVPGITSLNESRIGIQQLLAELLGAGKEI